MGTDVVMVFVVSIGASLLTGVCGSVFTTRNVRSWYPSLVKPSWTPPSWVFGPVWTVLYVLMGLACGFVYLHTAEPVRTTLTVLFGAHLFVNAFWSYAFFGRRNPRLAFYTIIVLWMLIILIAALFSQAYTLSGVLMIPYILWVSYALTLNAGIMILNSR